MKKLFFLTISILLFFITDFISGQAIIREDFLDAEFFLSEEDYREALYSFQKVYKAGYQDNANINYRIGICYLNIPGEKELSLPYLKKAVTNISKGWAEGSFKEVTAPPDAYLFLGNANRICYNLDDAIIAYRNYKEYLEKTKTVDIEYTDQQIKSCEYAKQAILNPAPIYKENLGRKYNSNAENSRVILSGDRNSMSYMTQMRFYDAVYYVKKINGAWSNAINITSQIESDGNQYVSSFSYDGQKLFLVKISNFDADILVSEYSMGRWMRSKSIGKPVNSKYFESHASISPDGKVLYFTSNRKESLGGMDIFYSSLNDKGDWSEPVNLGPVVNTPLNEESPFIAVDGKTLYFSSQGHESIGGYDYFKSVKQEDGTWSKPEPLPYPINTTDDDLFFFPSDKENSGYLTLYEQGGLGSGDLYYVEVLPEALATTEDEKILTQIEKQDTIEKEVTVMTKEPEKVSENKVVEEVPPTPSIKTVIKPIFFDFDSYSLSEISKSKLDEIVNVLKNFPEIRLEVRGYTDALGSIPYNQKLSEKRANTVVNYLVGKKIESSRFLIKGLNESENVAINVYPDGRDAKEGRKLNRRVEFRIVSDGGALIEIRQVQVPELLKVK